AAAAVVVDLEVAGGLGEAVLVVHVVQQVVQIEQVHLGGVLVLRDGRGLGQVRGEAAEVQGRAAIRARGAALVGVGDVVAVAVQVGVDVVAAGVGDLRPGDAVGVVPAERRGGRVGRVNDDGEAAVLRALVGRGDDVVDVVFDPVVLGHHRPDGGADTQVVPVPAVGGAEDDVPGERAAAVLP